ncbi:MAG: glycosyltransferase [Sphaerochaetaceae bacterium]
MRIVLCTESYLPILNGVVTFLQMLSKEWTKDGHAVLIIAPDHTARRNYIKDGVLHCPAVKSEQLTVDVSLPLDVARFRMVKRFKPDIIHIQHEYGVSLFGMKTAELLHIPVVYTLHSEYSFFMNYVVKSKLMVPIVESSLAKLIKYIVKRATVVTSPSRKAKVYFDSIGVDVDVTVIQNSVDLDDFDPFLYTDEQKQALRETLGIGAGETCVLFVGRMGPEKSVDVLLDYWAQTIKPEDRLHLVLIGGGPDDDSLRQHMRDLHLESMVTFCGRIPHVQIAPYYAICDLYITASLSEMHSVSMLEGLGAGLPVLQRYDRLNAEQLQEGVNGYFFNNAQEMGDLIHKLGSQTPQQKLETKRRVRESVLHTNNPKALADKYMEQYIKAIDLYVRHKAPPLDDPLM